MRTLWIAGLILPLIAAAAAPAESDAVAASVNGDPISVRDLLAETARDEEIIHRTRPPAERYQAVLQLRKAALDRQINRKLLLSAYEKQSFKIPEQYIENTLDEIALQQGIRSRREFYAKLREQKMSPEELRKFVREQLIIQAMTARRIQIRGQVTPREIRDYFDAHPNEFGKPELWDIGLIRLKPDSPVRKMPGGIKALAELLRKDPGRFDALCAIYSTGPHADKGGSLGYIPYASLRPEFAAVCSRNRTGTVIGPVRADDSDYFLMIRDIRKAEMPDFAKAEPALRKRMENERRKAIMDEYFRELRAEAIIRIYSE